MHTYSEVDLGKGIDRRLLLLGGATAAGAWGLTAGRKLSPPVSTPRTGGGNSVNAMLSPHEPAATTGAGVAEKTGNPTLGINLTPISYWTPVAFIDRLKACSGWDMRGAGIPTNAAGYPTGMGGQRQLMTMMPCEPGTYLLSHDGDMDVRIQGGTLVGRRRDSTVYDVRTVAATGRAMIIDAIRRAPTFMRLINQKDASAFAQGELFAPEFLAQIDGFDTLRFMDWMRTNGSDVRESLPQTDSCSYANGVPLEIMLALAKKIGAHPWLCVPHLATDTLVQRMIEALRRAGASGPAPYLEYSNEVWNLGFEQARYAQKEATARWGANTPGGTFYGYRAGQIARLARGSNIRVVLGTQTVTPYRADTVWEGVRRSGATDGDFAGWIAAAYISGTLTDPRGPALALASHQDVNAAIDNLMHADGSGALSVDTMRAIYTEQGRIARAHGLKLIAYEGNLHLNPLPNFAAQLNEIKPFFDAITKAPDSAKVMEANLDAFAAAGGTLACLYNLSSGASNGGFFGLVDSGSWGMIRQRLAARHTES